ncbi:MAG: redoxin domain-containing protein [Terracidiphilus sp.]
MVRQSSQVGAAHRLVFEVFLFALLAAVSPTARAQGQPRKSNANSNEGPTDPKAIKTFQSALELQKKGEKGWALEGFRKAFKQDNGQCEACLSRAYNLAMSIDAYKDAEEIARQWLPLVQTDSEKALVHYGLAMSLLDQGILDTKKEKFFTESRDEFQQALALKPSMARTQYSLGVSLAYLHQDDEARAAFQHFLDQDTSSPQIHDRAERFVERVDLARARMAPAFELTTLDGRHITMDGLAGKVVLIDFWATWCGPCREALPRIRDIARKYQEQPLVVLSISLDSDDAKWQEFVGKNEMTWLQYRDGGFGGKISKMFDVTAIPATFSIDADGVLEDQHVGDASIEGKLRKMIAHAVEGQNAKPAPPVASQAPGGGN